MSASILKYSAHHIWISLTRILLLLRAPQKHLWNGNPLHIYIYCLLCEGLLLSQSLDDLGTTQGEYLGRTRWSSPLDLTTYLYYFTSGCVPIITRSHVLPEHSMIT